MSDTPKNAHSWQNKKVSLSLIADDESHEQVQWACPGRRCLLQWEGRLSSRVCPEWWWQLSDPGYQYSQSTQKGWVFELIEVIRMEDCTGTGELDMSAP